MRLCSVAGVAPMRRNRGGARSARRLTRGRAPVRESPVPYGRRAGPGLGLRERWASPRRAALKNEDLYADRETAVAIRL